MVIGGDTAAVGSQLIRYTTTGTLDTSFNGTGIVLQPTITALDLIIQPDGKIIIAGTDPSTGTSFMLTRYNTD